MVDNVFMVWLFGWEGGVLYPGWADLLAMCPRHPAERHYFAPIEDEL